MAGINLESLVGQFVYIGFTQSLILAGMEPPGPTRLIFVRLTGVDERGLFFEHDRFPLTNKRTGQVLLAPTQVFVPWTKVAHLSAFPGIPNFQDYEPGQDPITFTT